MAVIRLISANYTFDRYNATSGVAAGVVGERAVAGLAAEFAAGVVGERAVGGLAAEFAAGVVGERAAGGKRTIVFPQQHPEPSELHVFLHRGVAHPLKSK